MNYYSDPTAWEAIGNTMRKPKEPEEQPEHEDVVRHGKLNETGGKHIHINRAEYIYHKCRKSLQELSTTQQNGNDAEPNTESKPEDCVRGV